MEEREIRHEVVPGEARIIARYRGGTVETYAVRLEAYDAGSWRTVELYDNAHGEHHRHRHTREGEKLAPEVWHHGDAREALPAAITRLQETWETSLEAWKRS